MPVTEHGHIGDGVYASDDGYHIWLAANHHDNKVVALEPQVFAYLLKLLPNIWRSDEMAEELRDAAARMVDS